VPRVVAEEWPAADGRFWPARKLYAGTRRGRALIGPALRRPAKPEAYAMRVQLAGVWQVCGNGNDESIRSKEGSRYMSAACVECLDAEAAGRGSAG